MDKIAIYHNLTSGGSKRELYEFTKRFNRNGNTVHLYGHNIEKTSYLDLTDWVAETYLFPFNLINKILFTLPFLKPIINLIIDLLNILKIDNVSKSMAREIDKNNYEFVFIHHNKDYVQSPFLLRYLKTKTVYFCNEPQRKFYDQGLITMVDRTKIYNEKRIIILYSKLTNLISNPCKSYLNRIIKKYDMQNINYCDIVLANSYYSREKILSAYGVDSKVVYLGGDFFKTNRNVQKRGSHTIQSKVISVGAINPLKGYEFLIKALCFVKKELRPILVIIGNSTDRVYLKKIREFALVQNVNIEIHENITDKELIMHLQQAKIFLYAPYLEPLGLAPLEAMSFGVPVIAIKEGGPREYVINEHNGLSVDRDPKLFGNAISNLFINETLYNKLSKNAMRDIEKFWNWNMAFDRLCYAIEEVY